MGLRFLPKHGIGQNNKIKVLNINSEFKPRLLGWRDGVLSLSYQHTIQRRGDKGSKLSFDRLSPSVVLNWYNCVQLVKQWVNEKLDQPANECSDISVDYEGGDTAKDATYDEGANSIRDMGVVVRGETHANPSRCNPNHRRTILQQHHVHTGITASHNYTSQS